MAQNNPITSYYFSGQGIVLVAPTTNGVAQGFRNVGNVSEFTINIETTVLEHQETSTGARAVDLRLNQENLGNATIVLENFTAENMALGFYGNSSTVTGTSVTDESLVIPTLGRTYALAHIGVSSVVVTNQAQTVTYVDGVEGTGNFTINAEVGSINVNTDQASPANAIAADDTVLIDYTYATYEKTGAFEVAQPERWVRLEGLNTADGNNAVVVDIFRFAADPATDFGLINEELSSMTLEGSILADQTKVTDSKYFNVRLLR